MIIYLPLLICLLGLLVYVIAMSNPNPNSVLAELGRIMFAMGLLAFLLIYPTGVLHVLR